MTRHALYRLLPPSNSHVTRNKQRKQTSPWDSPRRWRLITPRGYIHTSGEGGRPTARAPHFRRESLYTTSTTRYTPGTPETHATAGCLPLAAPTPGGIMPRHSLIIVPVTWFSTIFLSSIPHQPCLCKLYLPPPPTWPPSLSLLPANSAGSHVQQHSLLGSMPHFLCLSRPLKLC